MLYNLTVCKGV